MIIFPATDIIGGKAVRLTHGDYSKMTVYSDDPLDVALKFKECGAEYLHAVDLEDQALHFCGTVGTVEIVHRKGLLHGRVPPNT